MALVFAFTVIAPFGAFAGEYNATNTTTVDDDGVWNLGSFDAQFSPGELSPGDVLNIRLPEDFEFRADEDGDGVYDDLMLGTDTDASDNWTVAGATYKYGNAQNYIDIPEEYIGDDNALYDDEGFPLNIKMLDNNELQIQIKDDITLDSGKVSYFRVKFGAVYVDEGFSGDVEVRLDAPSGSGFDSGTINLSRVSGGEVDIEVTNAPDFGDDVKADGDDPVTIRIEEDQKGALDGGEDEALKFTLPDGLEWGSVGDISLLWGDENVSSSVEFRRDADELYIDTTELPDGTSEATAFEFSVGIDIEDETDVALGDVVVDVDGETDVTVDEITVGSYGQYQSTITAGDAPTIYAGQLEQVIADINIEESIANSLTDGRSILLTLPEGAKWGDEMDTDSDGNVELEDAGIVGDDGRTYKWSVDVSGNSSEAAELTLEDMEVMVEPGFEGDLIAEVGGTAGLEGDELLLAKVVPVITAQADVVDGLIIGRSAQDAGSITITEAEAGMIKDGKDIVVDLPGGVRFVGTPDVEVTEGDLEINDVEVNDDSSDDDNVLVISVEDDSTEASTIEISGIQYLLDRTVPEGDIEVAIKGDAIAEVNDPAAVQDALWGAATDDEDEAEDYDDRDIDISGDDEYMVFPNTEDSAVVVNAKVGTPAPGETKLTTSITLGDNGSYISDGRIMVQLRDAANALGVSNQNIFWDNATKTATLIKGDRAVQITVGKAQIVMNGTTLPTDKGAEIKDGHTFVSLSQAGVALGAAASWDNASKTATLTVQ